MGDIIDRIELYVPQADGYRKFGERLHEACYRTMRVAVPSLPAARLRAVLTDVYTLIDGAPGRDKRECGWTACFGAYAQSSNLSSDDPEVRRMFATHGWRLVLPELLIRESARIKSVYASMKDRDVPSDEQTARQVLIKRMGTLLKKDPHAYIVHREIAKSLDTRLDLDLERPWEQDTEPVDIPDFLRNGVGCRN